MRLLSFKHFELDLPAVLSACQEGRGCKTAFTAVFDLNDYGYRSIPSCNGDEVILEQIMIDIVHPELLACTGELKTIDYKNKKYRLRFNVIHGTQLIDFSFEITMSNAIGLHSFIGEVIAIPAVQPVEELSLTTIDYAAICNIIRSYKNGVPLDYDAEFNAFSTHVRLNNGIERSPRVQYWTIEMLGVISFNDGIFKIDVERATRFMKYIARANEIRAQLLLAEVADL